MKELNGHHVYGDYDTGKIWGFRYENGTVVDHREIEDSTHRIVSFGVMQGDDFVLLDHTAGTLHRLVANPKEDESEKFPRNLTDSGLFASLSKLTRAAGVSYSINAEPWGDHAAFERFVAIPGEQSINTESAAWKFPEGSVLVKTEPQSAAGEYSATIKEDRSQICHVPGGDSQRSGFHWPAG